MKKAITIILAILFLVSLYGCKEKSETPAAADNKSETAAAKPEGDAEPKNAGSISPDVMWAAIEADEYDNKTAYEGSFEMNADEFRKALCKRYPAYNHRPFSTDESSTDEDYLIKAGTVAVYTHDDGICIALVIIKDTHDLNDIRVVVFKSGSYSEFGVYRLGSLISDFGKSEKGAETCDSAIYVRENNAQLFLFVESVKGYVNSGTDYEYELRTYIVNNHLLNFCSDLKYRGNLGSRLTSRSMPAQFGKEHYTQDSGEYVLFCNEYKSDSAEYKEIHNGYTKISEAISEYFGCFGIERSKFVKKADACRLNYGTGIAKIAEFSFHAGGSYASVSLNDCTGLHR